MLLSTSVGDFFRFHRITWVPPRNTKLLMKRNREACGFGENLVEFQWVPKWLRASYQSRLFDNHEECWLFVKCTTFNSSVIS